MTVDKDGKARLHDEGNFKFGLGRPEDHYAHGAARDRPLLDPVSSMGITIATFDVTDWRMRSHGMDPYASQKLKVLDSTREERAQIGARYRESQLARAPELMQNNLEHLWATVQDPTLRKRSVFELWHECVEANASARAIQAGSAARAVVVAFVRERLPAGSPDAFTPAELAALNRHNRSRATFAPYD